MNANLKHKALKNLARTSGEDAQSALDKEAKKIGIALSRETQFDLLDEQLSLLESIAFRVSDEAIKLSLQFLERLETLNLTYQSSKWITEEDQKKFHNKNTLIKKILGIVERIRYYQTEQALDIFFKYAAENEDEEIRQQANHGLKSIAEFNLDVFQRVELAPQNLVIEKINSLKSSDRSKFFNSIAALCYEMLSPTLEGLSWSYKSLTIKTGSLPANDAVEQVRSKTLKILMDLYGLASSPAEKKTIINTLQQATRTPSNATYSDDFLKLIFSNTISVLEFYRQLISNEELEIIQKIEHDTFWLARRGVDDVVVQIALTIKEALDQHAEYTIFKHLIGYEGIFQAWNKNEDEDFQATRKIREEKAKEYAASITEKSYEEWKKRILLYSQIKSNDLATFPYFGKFLEFFGSSSPILALRLLNEEADALQQFVIAILIGIWSSDQKDAALRLVQDWTNKGLLLFFVARFFEFNSEIDEKILKQLLNIAIENNDKDLLVEIVIVATNHSERHPQIISELFFPAIEHLTELKESGWIFGFWYREEGKNLLESIDNKNCLTLLDNLIYLKNVDYHAEEIISEIAKKNPELVIEFFGRRIALKNAVTDADYDAVPFSFHKLAPALSSIPDKAIEIISGWYNNYGLFVYEGANLLKIIFPDFPEAFAKSLISYIRPEDEKTLMVVMAVLRNYEGQISTHPVSQALIKALPEDSKYLIEIEVALQSTGVVGGEFGFAEAYKTKREEITPWLSNPDEKIKKFANHYISQLDAMIIAEQGRAQERIALGKFEWGEDEDTADA